jgi:hypothetical protein
MRQPLSLLFLGILVVCAIVLHGRPAAAYPPGVGMVSKNHNCMGCHINNGQWDEKRTIIDVLDATTKKSLKDEHGVFRIDVPRGQTRTVLTVIGRVKGDSAPAFRRSAWMYVDPTQIETTSFSKFAPGWDVNIPLACRVVGDKLDGYDGAQITVLPMMVRPTDAARGAELELQVMLTSGESVKADPKKGMIGSYFVRKVTLKVIDQ